MFLTNKITLTKKQDGNIVINNCGTISTYNAQNSEDYDILNTIYEKARKYPESKREQLLINSLEYEDQNDPAGSNIIRVISEVIGYDPKNENNGTKAEIPVEERVKRGLKQLISFFSEWKFEPNFRFVNSFAYALAKSENDARDYVASYFKLMDSPYINEITNKMTSKEFNSIMKLIGAAKPRNRVNSRFKLYYGSAGTGKTTLAQKECDGRCIVCNNAMIPADLLQDFDFSEGQPTFRRSALREAMEEGLPIVLDEINLLPFDSLRFLQGILDNKKSFEYKGETIHIKDGFQIIGTMNLVVNGAVFGLPEPLVDRVQSFREFKLSADDLMSAILDE